jgi:hypothetical protein
MSQPAGEHSSKSTPVRRSSGRVLAVVLLALYFLIPIVFVIPLKIAYVERIISKRNYRQISRVFTPIHWLMKASPTYKGLIHKQAKLFYERFPEYSRD